MPSISEIQKTVQAGRNHRDRLEKDLLVSFNNLNTFDNQVKKARAEGIAGEELARLIEKLDAEQQAFAGKQKTFYGMRTDLVMEVSGLLTEPSSTLVENLSDGLPFLLFPVRIETKFMKGQTGEDQLWVRIFPDDISIQTHENDLTSDEFVTGQTYWVKVWESRELPEDDKKNAAKGAWNVAVSRYGVNRASWIRLQTKPVNWIDGAIMVDKPLFPELNEKMNAWSQGPRAVLLPDRFVVMGYNSVGGSLIEVLRAEGRFIADHLMVGPDPLEEASGFQRNPDGSILVSRQMQWLINFDQAVEAGMGLKIPITQQQAISGFDRVVVLGIRVSTDERNNGTLLESLFENHRYTKGLEILPQGTPTNNSEGHPSGFSSMDPGNEASFENEVKPDPEIVTDPANKPDGQRLAEALGLDPRVFFGVGNYELADISEAMAMNRALWNATMGGFMTDMLGGVISKQAIRETGELFKNYVTGRGQIPVMRIGKQPYGILTASAFMAGRAANEEVNSWQWSRGELASDSRLPNIQRVLNQLAKVWLQFSNQVKFSGDANDPFVTLLNILGLQAQSVEFHTRLAAADEVSLNYLAFNGTPSASYFPVWRRMLMEKSAKLLGIGLDLVHDPEKVNLRDLSFFEDAPILHGPVIDQEPELPLSESDGLAVNYIEWLLNTNEKSKILEGEFLSVDGEKVAEPKALFYKLLKQAYLNVLAQTGYNLVIQKEPAIAKMVFGETPISNMNRESRKIATEDLLQVDASKLYHDAHAQPLGDFILHDVVRPVRTISIQNFEAIDEVRQAMELLKDVPTARLERIFAEHMDLCSYRLDAWQTGLVSRRLESLRSSGSGLAQEITGGIHIGAFSWVENLRPSLSSKSEVIGNAKRDIENILGNNVDAKLYESNENAGYMMAPSLGQAITSAVLRNAYLTHAERGNESAMAVNLSSERVRTALFYLDGLKNGQELGALLGYQFERGLHERYPLLELDEFIYVFRAKFPLIAGKLTKIEDGTPAELVEARNVVNGYDLLNFVRGKQYPFGISDLPSDLPASSDLSRAKAIQSEIELLNDALDAIGDLSLAESVYQVVEGNYDRARGILQSVTEGKNPPDIQFVNTPRSGQGITHRVAITFDSADTAGWHADLTPRAQANKLLNAWLKHILPAPDLVQVRVATPTGVSTVISLIDLPLEPIDIILMAGDNVGDNSSDLERYLVNHFRKSNNVADEVVNFFFVQNNPAIPAERSLVFHPDEAEDGKISLSAVWFILKSMKAVLGKSRPMNAQDLILPSEGQNLRVSDRLGFYADDRPELNNLKELTDRLVSAKVDFANLLDSLQLFYVTTAKPLYDLMFLGENQIIDPVWDGHLSEIRELLLPFVLFGIPEAMPASWRNEGNDAEKLEKIQTLVRQAEAVIKISEKKLSKIQTDALLESVNLPADTKKHQEIVNGKVLQLTEAGKQLLGESFVIIPSFKLFNSSALSTSIANSTGMATNLETAEWLEGVGRVRPAMQHLNHFIGLSELMNEKETVFQVVQMPFRSNEKWIGLPFGDAVLEKEYLSVLLHQPPGNTDLLQSGLLLDEWTELIPTEKETMGIAFHYDRPNSVAPQSLILAVSPNLTGNWSWQDLSNIVNETLDRAKMRAVEPDMILDSDYATIFPTVLQSFTRNPHMNSTMFANVVPSVIQNA